MLPCIRDAEQTQKAMETLRSMTISSHRTGRPVETRRRLSHPFISSPSTANSRLSRAYATRSSDTKSPLAAGSIFAKNESAWDHVFSDIQDMPPPLPTRSSPRSRRQTMTAREVSAFDEMFTMIFSAVSGHKSIDSPTEPPQNVGIGRAPNGVGASDQVSDFFTKMRGKSKKLHWTTQSDEELDRKKEEMELCETDQQLLVWAMREVFGESQRYHEAALQAMKQVEEGGELKDIPDLQPAIYPRLVALLIRQFRDKYRDPHLALSMFDHARHLSVASYVFGCTTPAYNELIETRWRCFRDLKGVHDALEEMVVNGVDLDNRTRKLIEDVRREVGERNKWEEETELGSGEVWGMMNKIEALVLGRPGVAKRMAKTPRAKPSDEAWKKDALTDNDADDWQFDSWEPEEKPDRPLRSARSERKEQLRDLDF
ncbi:hypothetical protein HWV62_16120 [Athelia sp. TMB]|nr:hypothetical protein HWV62_16120 [Athelia sp. TMB]